MSCFRQPGRASQGHDDTSCSYKQSPTNPCAAASPKNMGQSTSRAAKRSHPAAVTLLRSIIPSTTSNLKISARTQQKKNSTITYLRACFYIRVQISAALLADHRHTYIHRRRQQYSDPDNYSLQLCTTGRSLLSRSLYPSVRTLLSLAIHPVQGCIDFHATFKIARTRYIPLRRG